MEFVTLNNGIKMPQLGYGVYQVTQEECERCVEERKRQHSSQTEKKNW